VFVGIPVVLVVVGVLYVLVSGVGVRVFLTIVLVVMSMRCVMGVLVASSRSFPTCASSCTSPWPGSCCGARAVECGDGRLWVVEWETRSAIVASIKR
jgi:hypothetical protein